MATSTRIALRLEYDGTKYYGFQWQAGVPTIQSTLENAITKLTGEKRRVLAASRTDTGVHALGQIASFRTESSLPLETFVKGLNYYLPADIGVRTAFRMSDAFDVRRDAISREYRYNIWNGASRSPFWGRFAWFVPGGLDMDLMKECCSALVGEHDFSSLTTLEDTKLKDTVRQVERAGLSQEGNLITFEIVANSFLRHQVRNTVGALVRVGQGRMTVKEFGEMIEAKIPGLAGLRAPGGGLFLMKVNYTAPFWEEKWGDYHENHCS